MRAHALACGIWLFLGKSAKSRSMLNSGLSPCRLGFVASGLALGTSLPGLVGERQ